MMMNVLAGTRGVLMLVSDDDDDTGTLVHRYRYRYLIVKKLSALRDVALHHNSLRGLQKG